ncbi:MAG: hypothetical protein HYY91_03920 [Candidatus Omnitrophica bacterium]|nr:hypothetical protein [Candidatus Omnitrophota bacterium]
MPRRLRCLSTHLWRRQLQRLGDVLYLSWGLWGVPTSTASLWRRQLQRLRNVRELPRRLRGLSTHLW